MFGLGDRRRLMKVEWRRAKQAHETLAHRKAMLQRELVGASTALRGFDRKLRVAQLEHEIRALAPDLRQASARVHSLSIDLERMQ
jgi:hypothetical protein